MQRILIADDDNGLLDMLQRSLNREGYDVVSAVDGMQALTAAGRHRPDAIVLDLEMPVLDGLHVCQSLRRDPDLAQVPIIFLTGHDSIDTRVRCLDAGGDDYVAKPYDVRELKARLRALLRRSTAHTPTNRNLLQLGDLQLNLQSSRVIAGSRVAQLTPAELDLMHYLIQRPDTVFSSQHLLHHVWGYPANSADQSLVRWHVMNLRLKIEPTPSQPIYLRTVPRHGYMLCEKLQSRAA
ncbi:MAG: response regulator transcription factor [Oscillochloris sp.]|nr:response regulator transcription factor [Oscillochloris sp.]